MDKERKRVIKNQNKGQKRKRGTKREIEGHRKRGTQREREGHREKERDKKRKKGTKRERWG